MSRELQRRWQLERWISWVRLIAVPWAVIEVTLFTPHYPAGWYRPAAWATTAVLAVGALVFFRIDRAQLSARYQSAVCLTALAFDTGVIWAYAVIYTFEPGTPIRQLLFFPVVEAALRYGLV